MPVQATARQSDQTAALTITEVPTSPVPVFLLGAEGEAPRYAVVREGTAPQVVAAQIQRLTAEWADARKPSAETDCDSPDDTAAGIHVHVVDLTERPSQAALPFDETAEGRSTDDDPQYRVSRSGEGIDRLRSVQDEHAAHAQWLRDHDPVVAAGVAVEQLRSASANSSANPSGTRNATANEAAQDTARATQQARWHQDDQARDAAASGALEAVR